MDDPAKIVFDDSQKSVSASVGGISIGGKEKEAVSIGGELPLTPIGQEVELPKEVISTGVSVRPMNVPIPPKVSQMGVKPLGQNVSATPATGTITLPLTDDQIAQGMRQSATTSWRWLTEWCKRRLKQIHARLRGN